MAHPDPTSASQPLTQVEMVHRLPPALIVDRIPYLVSLAREQRTIHVGFVDSGCWDFHDRFDAWLHGHLAASAASLVGVDVDGAGVAEARRRGFEAHIADCTNPAAVAALGIEPGDLVVAGEVIEHLDNPGGFLAGLHVLVKPGGRLVLTTPNASGLLNAGAAATASREVNHPDHVVLYSCFTLSNILARHGWEVDEVRTYVPVVKQLSGMNLGLKALALGARGVLGIERLLGRLGRPYAADGLIVVARSAR
jgi:SAM-dependent methyltransferase